MAIRNILKDQGYDLQTMHCKKNNEEQWKSLNIKPGIGI